MVNLSGGAFLMGSDVAGPIHRVTLDSFWIDVGEVTVADYSRCVTDGGCTLPGGPGECNWGFTGREQHPVNCVDWSQADAFCRWAGKRLPAEEEWEYAARSQGSSTFPWGEAPQSAARTNQCDDKCTGSFSSWGSDGYAETSPVGSFPLGDTAEGVHDMDGNVWEWCASLFCAYPSEPCNSCPPLVDCSNPCTSCAVGSRVLRGASWKDVPTPGIYWLRGDGLLGTDYIGFRCAR